MTDRLGRLIRQLQDKRKELLEELEQVPDHRLHRKPSADGWSPAEIAEHVARSESLLIGYVRRLVELADQEGTPAHLRITLDDLPLSIPFIPRSLLRFPPFLLPLSTAVYFLPLSVETYFFANPLMRMKTAPEMEPAGGFDRPALLEYMYRTRRATLETLRSTLIYDPSQLRWSHPLIGSHDLNGLLSLVAGHEERHLQQIRQARQ